MSFQFEFGDDVLGDVNMDLEEPPVASRGESDNSTLCTAPSSHSDSSNFWPHANTTTSHEVSLEHHWGKPTPSNQYFSSHNTTASANYHQSEALVHHDASTMPPPSPRTTKSASRPHQAQEATTSVGGNYSAVLSPQSEDSDNPTHMIEKRNTIERDAVPPRDPRLTASDVNAAENGGSDSKYQVPPQTTLCATSGVGDNTTNTNVSAQSKDGDHSVANCVKDAATDANAIKSREISTAYSHRLNDSDNNTAHGSSTKVAPTSSSDEAFPDQNRAILNHVNASPARAISARVSDDSPASDSLSFMHVSVGCDTTPQQKSRSMLSTPYNQSSPSSGAGDYHRHNASPASLDTTPFLSRQTRSILSQASETLKKANEVIGADCDDPNQHANKQRESSNNDAIFTTKMSSISHSATRQAERLDQLASDYAVKQLSMLTMLGPLEKEPQLIEVFKKALPTSLHGAPAVHFMPHLLTTLESVLNSLQSATEHHREIIEEILK